MTIRVLIFGALARELSRKEIVVQVDSPATALQVGHALARQFPAKADFFRAARLAVNHAFATPDSPVSSSDEVALIEMVGGG